MNYHTSEIGNLHLTVLILLPPHNLHIVQTIFPQLFLTTSSTIHTFPLSLPTFLSILTIHPIITTIVIDSDMMINPAILPISKILQLYFDTRILIFLKSSSTIQHFRSQHSIPSILVYLNLLLLLMIISYIIDILLNQNIINPRHTNTFFIDPFTILSRSTTHYHLLLHLPNLTLLLIFEFYILDPISTPFLTTHSTTFLKPNTEVPLCPVHIYLL